MSTLKFSQMKLSAPILKAIQAANYVTPSPIQAQTIPLALEGHDILGIAQTGTGKTAAFCLPTIHNLDKDRTRPKARSVRSLILTPTRELAIQIHQSLETYGKQLNQKYVVIFGGVNQSKQVRSLSSGADVLVATPGRLLDLIGQKFIKLEHVEVFVLDEADRMLDMGFKRDIDQIIKLLPRKRHNLFFSATMPSSIQKLAANILVTPKKVEITPQATTVEKITQSVMYVEKDKKMSLLTYLLKDLSEHKILIFVEMKHAANRMAKKLETVGINTAVIHGNKSQAARQRAIKDFASDKLRVMIATDIASRGIDIDGISHVINYELSNVAESYVHRIGRTARAGTEGIAISLVTADEKSFLVNIEKTIKQKININSDHPYHSATAQEAPILKLGVAKAKLERERKTRPGTRRAPSRSAAGGRAGQARRPTRSGAARKKPTR